MRRTFMLSAALVLVLSTVFASGYRAEVGNSGSVVICETQFANLAFVIPENPIAESVARYEAGKVVFDFGRIQPCSLYQYEDVLIVKNNEPFTVYLSVATTHEEFSAAVPDPKVHLEIWVFYGDPGRRIQLFYDGALWSECELTDGAPITFVWTINEGATLTGYTATITWRAVATSP